MSKLTERFVQEASIKKLQEHYAAKYNLSEDKIYAKKEAKTRYKRGNGRADGLLAFTMQNGKTYSVVVEAKSGKTMHNLKTRYRDKRFISFTVIFLLVAFSLSLFLLRNQTNLMQWGLAIAISLVATILIFIIVALIGTFEHIDVINQVRRYPANERWIALSKDVHNRCLKDRNNEIDFHARKHNIGILVVSPNKNVQVLRDAKSNRRKKYVDYTKYYNCSKNIEIFLNKKNESITDKSKLSFSQDNET